jgi:pimeloyl-ACP methyl ester carboxylesterase
MARIRRTLHCAATTLPTRAGRSAPGWHHGAMAAARTSRRTAPRRARRGRAGRWAFLAGSIAVLVGCGLEDGSHLGASSTTTTTPPEPVPVGPDDPLGYQEGECPFTEPSGVEVTCGTLTVPRDRARPEEGTVDVAVARLHATDPDPEGTPLLYFEGGPGGASLVYADWWSDHRLLRGRDIVLFDQRGTGYSTPSLGCEDELAKYDDESVAGMQACFERLADTTDLADFTTREAAHDVADLMAALELDRVDLLGVSYGTRLALVTADVAPDRVRSIVLDSVYPPGVEALELQAPNAAGAFEALYEACDADAECRREYGDLESLLHDAVRRLDDEPVEIETTDAADEPTTSEVIGDDLVDSVFGALYDRAIVGDIPHAIELAASGDPESVQEAFDLLDGMGAYSARGEDEPSSDSDGLYYSVTCSEEMPVTTLDEVYDAAGDVDPVLRGGLVASAEYDIDVCKIWDAGQDEAEPLESVESDLPALLLAGSLDPITPPHWAHEAAGGLPNGYVVELAGVGHGVMDSHLCGMELVMAFLDHPTEAPDDDCAGSARAPDFTVE